MRTKGNICMREQKKNVVTWKDTAAYCTRKSSYNINMRCHRLHGYMMNEKEKKGRKLLLGFVARRGQIGFGDRKNIVGYGR